MAYDLHRLLPMRQTEPGDPFRESPRRRRAGSATRSCIAPDACLGKVCWDKARLIDFSLES
jgi:hypothetical protein